MLIAPYNNAMRLGQGFNSYTQQICLDRAVLIDPHWKPKDRREADLVLSEGSAGKTGALPTATDLLLGRQLESVKEEIERLNIAAAEVDKPTPEEEEPTVDESTGSYAIEGGDNEAKSPAKKPLIKVEGKIAKQQEIAAKLAHALQRQRELSSDIETSVHKSALVQGDTGETTAVKVPSWVKPQIVTYSSRFVDKISDVTDAMNVAGSISIKAQQIGGKANGSYVDSDKFKSSDINFHLQVRVTNQIHDPQNYTEFNDIANLKETDFAKVYGDCFISGWEEGGELNAIISVKVLDKSKIFEIKAGLEASLNTGSIAGEVKGQFEMTKNNLSKETETTIAVNWSGGGSIKDPAQDWSIKSLKAAAAAFPELVAVTPQRTYAILTKYTSLKSFHDKKKDYSPLSYENAGIYTSSLLDAYVEYRSLWKQISHAQEELKANRASIEIAQTTEEMDELAKVRELPANQLERAGGEKATVIVSNSASTQESSTVGQLNLSGTEPERSSFGDKEKVTHFRAFRPSFAGLIRARKVARFEMAKIVNEVDLVTKDPLLATDTRRDSYFLSPIIFEQLLPIVRSVSLEPTETGVRDPSSALLLGYLPPQEEEKLPQLYQLEKDFEMYDGRLQSSLNALRRKAHYYRMQGCAGELKVHSSAVFFNHLQHLDQTRRPTAFSFWVENDHITGLAVEYAHSGGISKNGRTDGEATHRLTLKSDGSEAVVEVVVREDHLQRICSIALATSLNNTIDTSISAAALTKPASSEESVESAEVAPQPQKYVAEHVWNTPEDGMWTVRGFFGFFHKDGLYSFGPVWGKDGFVPVPMAPLTPCLSRTFLDLDRRSQEHILYIARNSEQFLGKFLMGKSVNTRPQPDTSVIAFNSLRDIDLSWKIRRIGFAVRKDRAELASLRIVYSDSGRERTFTYGSSSPEDTLVWDADVKSSLVAVRLVAGKLGSSDHGYVDTMEFIRSTPTGGMPHWPLDVSTLRYLGIGDERVKEDLSVVVESAPKAGRDDWSVRGFYGEATSGSDGFITRLGVIWGCA